MPAFRLLFVLPFFLCLQVRADPVAELRGVLARQGQAPVKALVEVKAVNRMGEGKELEETAGEASVNVEDGPQGLRVAVARDLLLRVEREEQARAADPKAKTPGLTGMRELLPLKLRELLNPAAKLSQLLDRAKLTGQRAEAWMGKPATLLSFELAQWKAAGKEAEYVKNYKGTLDLWIGADGLPLAGKVHQVIGGRAFVFFNFETVQDSEYHYGQAGDRLLLLKCDERRQGSGTAGKSEGQVTHLLKPVT